MHKRIIAAVLSVLLCCLALAGCKQETGDLPVEYIINEDGSLDPLNGSSTVSEYCPLIVMLDNSEKARPQTGVQSADIVYEAAVEANITRLMAVFNSKKPTKIGPVRSARVHFIPLAAEYDGIFVYYGGTKEAGHPGNIYEYMEEIGNPFQRQIDGTGENGSLIFRQKGKKAPHNAYLDTEKAMELYDFDSTIREFQFDSQYLMGAGNMATTVIIPFNNSSSKVEYQYDASTNEYLRFQNDKVFEDAQTGEQVRVQNVVIQYVKYTPIPNSQRAEVIGSGRAVICMDGIAIEGTWSKESATDPTIFKDASGEEIKFRPGNTWIHLLNQNVEATIS